MLSGLMLFLNINVSGGEKLKSSHKNYFNYWLQGGKSKNGIFKIRTSWGLLFAEKSEDSVANQISWFLQKYNIT